MSCSENCLGEGLESLLTPMAANIAVDARTLHWLSFSIITLICSAVQISLLRPQMLYTVGSRFRPHPPLVLGHRQRTSRRSHVVVCLLKIGVSSWWRECAVQMHAFQGCSEVADGQGHNFAKLHWSRSVVSNVPNLEKESYRHCRWLGTLSRTLGSERRCSVKSHSIHMRLVT